jgi:hypothetical protein
MDIHFGRRPLKYELLDEKPARRGWSSILWRTVIRADRLVAVVFSFGLILLARPAEAQRAGGDVGLGLQIGEPSGVTLQFYNPGSMSWDFLAAWDVDDFFFLNVHGLYYRDIGQRNDVHLFYGPGAFIGIRDRGRDEDDDVVVGISGTIGIGIMVEQFQIFASVTPRLSLIPGTDGDVGAGVGVRYYF